MGWSRKLLRREPDHDEWLAAHPGKESMKSAPASRSEEDQQKARAQMEEELDAARAKRDTP